MTSIRFSTRELLCLALLFAWLTLTPAAHAARQDAVMTDAEAGAKSNGSESDADAWMDGLVVTDHSIMIDGEVVDYTATAGTFTMATESGEPQADLFFIAYTRDDVEDPADRPITFAFNGGPGSSSVWLHLGVFGPRRVEMDDEGFPLPPPYRLVDNDQSLLDLTDFVFIDPVMTGYSRPAEGVNKSDFHGIDEDVESVGEFIRLYTTRFGRWNSPKFLAGESYGTTRAAGLSGHLQDRHGLYLNGIVLVSSILNFQTARFDRGNDLPYIVFLPTYTATAWYHDQLGDELQADLEAAVDAAREFALGDYTLALMQGSDLDQDERSAIVTRLAQLTGLSEEYIDRGDLRIPIFEFTKELLRDEDRTVGRLDSRFTGIDANGNSSSPDYDPSYAAIEGPYTATLNDYVRRELGYKSDLPYEILTGRVHPWSYRRYQNRYVNVADTLRSAMTKNRDLHVYVANGYYDLATPFFATEYTFTHLGLPPELQDHVTMGYYESGHMMYIQLESLRRMRDELVSFYDTAIPD
ncbi:MAG: S10 family peptidase [Phycisphaerales bacterium]